MSKAKEVVWTVITKEKIRLNTSHPYSIIIADSGGHYGICRVSYAGALWLCHRQGNHPEDQAVFLLEALKALPSKVTRLDIYITSTFSLRCLKGQEDGPLFQITGWAKKWRHDGWVKASGKKVSTSVRQMVEQIDLLIEKGVVIILHKTSKDSSEMSEVEGFKEAHQMTKKK